MDALHENISCGFYAWYESNLIQTLDNVDNLTITLQNIHQIRRFAIPNEKMPRITPADHVLIVQAEEIDVFDGLDIAMSTVDPRVSRDGRIGLDLSPA
jgi:hypothetical protein